MNLFFQQMATVHRCHKRENRNHGNQKESKEGQEKEVRALQQQGNHGEA
jgi:hypothetical protein